MMLNSIVVPSIVAALFDNLPCISNVVNVSVLQIFGVVIFSKEEWK